MLCAVGGRICMMDGHLLRYGERNQFEDVVHANPRLVAIGDLNPL